MDQIHTREEFVKLARTLGVRDDWHEPDEQEVTAEVRGGRFDNAGYWGAEDIGTVRSELHVVLSQSGKPVAAVNLADLCAWASQT